MRKFNKKQKELITEIEEFIGTTSGAFTAGELQRWMIKKYGFQDDTGAIYVPQCSTLKERLERISIGMDMPLCYADGSDNIRRFRWRNIMNEDSSLYEKALHCVCKELADMGLCPKNNIVGKTDKAILDALDCQFDGENDECACDRKERKSMKECWMRYYLALAREVRNVNRKTHSAEKVHCAI